MGLRACWCLKLMQTLFPGKLRYRKMNVNLTFQAFSEFLAWSFEILSTGSWPTEPYVPGVLEKVYGFEDLQNGLTAW